MAMSEKTEHDVIKDEAKSSNTAMARAVARKRKPNKDKNRRCKKNNDGGEGGEGMPREQHKKRGQRVQRLVSIGGKSHA